MQIKQLLYAAALPCLLLSGCASDTPSGIDAGNGRIVLSVGVDGSVADVKPTTRSSQATLVPDASELNLKLTKADGSYSHAWGSVADFPTNQQFKTGAYTLEAYYGAIEYEGFDSPYYYGMAQINVVEGEETEVAVTASLANSMVSIEYTDAFKAFFPTYSATLHTAGGDYLQLSQGEERPVYVKPGSVSLDVAITKQNGLSATLQAAEFDASARHHYHLVLDVNDGETGQGVLQVLFDDSIVQEDVEIDISDAVLLMPGPRATPTGFSDATPIIVAEGETPARTLVTLNAPGGLRSVTLTTQSDDLLAAGFPAEIDLMKASEAQQNQLSALGLDVKGLYNKPDKMAVVDFTGLFANVVGNGTHTFTLVAVDKMSKTHDPLTLSAISKGITLQIESLPEVMIDQNQATMVVNYDGADFENKVSLELQTPNGDWIHPAYNVSATRGNYTLQFTLPSELTDYPVRLKYAGKVKATGTVHKGGVLISATEGDVWATHATFSVKKNQGTPLSAITFYTSTDESNYSVVSNVTANSDGTVTLSGLTPGTTLHVKASDTGSLSGAYRPTSITTETAQQPQGGNMDSWSKDAGWSKKAGLYNNTIYNYFPNANATDNEYWATRNALTTNQGFGYTSMWYNYYAGTYNVAGVNGTNCAEITTVGFAKTNANTYVGATGGNINHRSAGYLFMGTYTYDQASDTETFSYGRPFTSRPTALTFMYKFTSYNSESFKAYVVVENRQGGKTTELGRAELVSADDKGSFTQATLPIKYTNTKLKATHAYVVFVSSTAENPGVIGHTGSKNAFAGYTDSRYYGNVLDVDNIAFTY